MSRFNIVIDQGATFSQRFQILDINGDSLIVHEANGNPLYTATAQMRKSYQASNSVVLDTAISNGMLTLSLSPEASANIVPGRYVFDVELSSNSNGNVVNRIVEGVATVKPEATKS